MKDLKKKKVKLIIGELDKTRALQVMCEAYHQNMTARQGYVWFLPIDFSPNWYDTDWLKANDTAAQDKLIPCPTAQMIQAINGHLGLTYSAYASNDTIMQVPFGP